MCCGRRSIELRDAGLQGVRVWWATRSPLAVPLFAHQIGGDIEFHFFVLCGKCFDSNTCDMFCGSGLRPRWPPYCDSDP